MLWGDVKRAAQFQNNDPLATLLFQIASPAHIPWGDARWQEILTGYDVWVHMELGDDNTISQACDMMAKHAFVSSNLAALSLHVTRMLRELARDIQNAKATNDFSSRIARVAKARATAGALQLLRLLCHSVVLKCSHNNNCDEENSMEEAFTYHSRGDLPCDQLASRPLINSILDLIVVVGKDHDALNTPEVYDTIVLSFQLLLVLFGTQLYQPFESSKEPNNHRNHIHSILQELFQETETLEDGNTEKDSKNLRMFYASSRNSPTAQQQHNWTPQSLLETCLKLKIRRPKSPERSIARYYYTIAQSAVKGGELRGPDGMYESPLVVQATAPDLASLQDSSNSEANSAIVPHEQSHNIIMDATKGVLTLSSSIILLPFRLVSLVYGALVHSKGQHSRDIRAVMANKFQSSAQSRTKDVLWLSDSILADLGSCFFLLLANNNREGNNPFRKQLTSLVDNRWDHDNDSVAILPDLPSLDMYSSGSLSMDDKDDTRKEEQEEVQKSEELTLNFESLFEAFGRTLHTEVGALMLYTLVQSSPSFAKTLAVRSDIDTLVMPLLRTLYFASQSNTYMAKDYASRRKSATNSSQANAVLDIRSCPFRSQSQLYVIIILLLLFSQDSSFGRDAFRRITVSHVVWYKERHLRHINLGSVLLLTLLRSVLFNLQRLHDPFLLSNSCAVLMNLSPSIIDLHEYAAMRLASVTISVTKRHSKLKATSNEQDEDDLTTPLGMYSEVAHNLLSIITDCLSPRKIERNLHLIYALVYHQADFTTIFNDQSVYSSKKTDRILAITKTASVLIQEEGARSAPKALKVLESKIETLKNAAAKKKKKEKLEDFTFTYEEDTDPETFFVPYLWEVIVCVVTSGTIEWKKDGINAFALLEPVEVPKHVEQDDAPNFFTTGSFEPNAADLV